MDTVANGAEAGQGDLEQRVSDLEFFHRSRVEESIRLTARVQLLEQLVLDMSEAHANNRTEHFGEIIAFYRKHRDFTGEPDFTTVDGQSRRLPPPRRLRPL